MFRFGLIFILFCFALLFSCKSNSKYPCPGNGQFTPQQLSLFDEDGKPAGDKKGRKNKETGLVNKKKDESLKRHIPTSLNDKPKVLKK